MTGPLQTGADTTPLPLGTGEIHIWSAPLDLPGTGPERCLSLLAPEEQLRARRFRIPAVRTRFVIAHTLLRRMLAAYLGVTPGSLVFACGPHGKPFLAAPEPARTLHFNLSHADDLLLVAVARDREVGIDLERISPDCDVLAIAARIFSPREVSDLLALSQPLQREAFYRCWTRKEAYVKGRGEGLALPFDRFTVAFAPGEPAALLANELVPADVGQWRLDDLDLPGGYAGAVATTAGPATYIRRRWQEYSPATANACGVLPLF